MANGPLHRAKLPGIPGIETFKGHSFHTSRWDYAYTGGTNEGNLTGLATSASASLAPARRRCSACRTSARRRRSCTSSSARRRRSTCAPTGRPIRSGRRAWSRAGSRQRMDNFNILVSGGFQDEDLVSDGWTDIIRKLLVMVQRDRDARLSPEATGQDDGAGGLREDGGDPRARGHDRERPGDGGGAEAVLPAVLQAPVLPRRVPRHLQPAERDARRHERKGVERITEKGIVANGEEYELDCIIFATGFEVGRTTRAGRDTSCTARTA